MGNTTRPILEKTWHLHAVRNYQAIPPQTDDIAKSEIFECRKEPLVDGDSISLPFELVLLNSTKIRRGAVRTVGSGSCRDYEITVLTPYDMLHHDYQFTMCINELDHLPRQPRRDARISGHEDSVEYSKWGDLSEPPLPYGIPQ